MSDNEEQVSSYKACLYVAVYVIGMFMTNAYCQVCRWDDWKKGKTHAERIVAATALWPGYWFSRGCTYLVDTVSDIEITYEQPEE